MKQKYFLLLTLLLVSFLGISQTTSLPYKDYSYDVEYPSAILNNFSTCQIAASITASSQGYDQYYTGTWDDSSYTLIVNGINIGTYNTLQTIDISSYIPITSVQMNGNYDFYSWVDLSVNITSNDSSMPTSGPTVSTVNYFQGDIASPLSATLTSTGTTFKWYTDQFGDNYSATGPTPSTATIGTTSYWVAQADSGGCESVRSEIVVNVLTPGTHLNFDGTNDYAAITSPYTSFTNEISVEFWVNRNGNIATGSGIGQSGNTDSMASNVWIIHGNSNNSFTFYVNEGGTWRDSGPCSVIPLNTWTHIAAVADANGVRIYVNGILSNNSTSGITSSILSNPTSHLHIGKDSRYATGTGRNFNGSFDEVRVWNNARTVEQINGSMNCELQGSESNLVGYYQFNQGVDQSNNTSVTTLNATSGQNGTLFNFSLNGATSNWLSGSPVTTGNLVPGNPTATSPIIYTQGDAASALTATIGNDGTGLLWHATETGGTGSTSAPTPVTSSVGSTSYWVSSTNANGCESDRIEIVVTVNSPLPATHLNFDGTNDRITGTNSNLPQGNSPRTIEAWVKNSTGNDMTIFNYGNVNAVNNQVFTLHLYNGVYIIGMNNDINTGFNINDGNWHHVAVSHDGTNTRIYVDGNLINTTAKTFNTTGNDFQIGTTFRNGSYIFNLNGSLDDIRVWNVARTAEQIAGSMNCELNGSENGLVAYYQFNQGADQADNSGITTLNATTGPNGTLTNFTLNGATSNWLAGSSVTTGSVVPGYASASSPINYNQGDSASALTATTGTNGTGLMWYTSATGGTGSTTAPTPSTASAGSTSYWVASTNANGCESERIEIVVNVTAYATHLNFDGSNDFIVSANAITNNTQNQTYQAWFRIPSIPTNNDRILQRGSDGTGGWSVQMDVNNAGRLSAGISASPDTYITGTTTLVPNTWYHATFVFENNNSLRLYLNGTLEASVSIGNRTLRNSDNRLRVGSGNIASEYFNGDIDEVRVWNMALSETDILNTYNCELANGETNLVLYYKLNQGFDSANNTGITSAPDSSGNNNNGTLTNFALSGSISNWAFGSAITTGNTCSTILNSEDFEVNAISLYPNPTTGVFSVRSNVNLTIEIYDLLGKTILTKKINSGIEDINITNYPSGIYLIKSTDEQGNSKMYKIIKK